MRIKVSRKRFFRAIVAGLFGLSSVAIAQQLERGDCSELNGELAAACREALTQNAAPQVFLSLGKRLMESRNVSLAVKVYKRGMQMYPDNDELEAQWTVADSSQRELKWIEEQKNNSNERDEASVKAEVFKCTRLARSAPQTALDACETALAVMPKDPRLFEAKGDALEKMDSHAEAYLAYAAAAKLKTSTGLTEKLAALAEYKPRPKPRVKPETAPGDDQIAKTSVPAAPKPSETAMSEETAKAAAQRAARTIKDPGKGLGERLTARNELMRIARRAGN